MRNCNAQRPATQQVCAFLSEYSAWLLGCGATCIRLENNVRRMAEAYNMEVEITIMPRHVHISVCDRERAENVTSIASVRHTAVSFNLNTMLSTLSWEVADGKRTFEEARIRLDAITRNDSQNKWTVLFLVSIANAAFCRLFGGDGIAMIIVCMATLAGYYLKQIMLERDADIRMVVLACSFVSTVIGATDILFSLGNTPDIALATSVLYLIPGIPFLNSFSDMLYRHYICAFSRFADAAILTGCLSAGLCGGMALMNVRMF